MVTAHGFISKCRWSLNGNLNENLRNRFFELSKRIYLRRGTILPPTLSPQLERKKVFMAFGLAPFAQSPDLMEGSSNYLFRFLVLCSPKLAQSMQFTSSWGNTPRIPDEHGIGTIMYQMHDSSIC